MKKYFEFKNEKERIKTLKARSIQIRIAIYSN